MHGAQHTYLQVRILDEAAIAADRFILDFSLADIALVLYLNKCYVRYHSAYLLYLLDQYGYVYLENRPDDMVTGYGFDE